MNRRGMTLVEMLVATAVTLVLMGAIAQIFSVFGTAVSDSRSIIELDARLRAAAWLLRTDLGGATASMLPPLRPDANEGYFEIIEGPNSDTRLFFDPVTNKAYGAQGFDKASATPDPTAPSDDRILGDTDDVLLFTTRSNSPAFLGRYVTPSGTSGPDKSSRNESSVAEVAWFLRPTWTGTGTARRIASTNPTTYTLYRRQLLVIGYVAASPFLKVAGTDQNLVDTQLLAGKYASWTKFYDAFDLSVRGSAYTVNSENHIAYFPNTLSDLTRRESRFMHNRVGGLATGTGTGVPYGFIGPRGAGQTHQLQIAADGLFFDANNDSQRVGEDVVLTNVIGFDVRVFDPTAPVVVPSTDAALVPGDPLYRPGTSATATVQGCYVDLGNNVVAVVNGSTIVPRFSSYGLTRSSIVGSGTTFRTWDTWSTHYESNGVDEDGGTSGIDQGTNGFDDDDDGLIDEPPADTNGDGVLTDAEVAAGELETSPPYPYPLRGIEVRIRCYEPSSRQVRQMTVRETFVR